MGIREKCNFVQSDFFETSFKDNVFDSALIGFLLSHLSLKEEETFFKRLRKILKPDSELMVIDSIWSRRRQQYRQKEGVQERSLNDGHIFAVYKRYLSESDIEETLLRHHFQLDSYRAGDAWFTAIYVKANKDID